MSDITWTAMQPGWSWRSDGGKYVILRHVLPEPEFVGYWPSETYTLRKIDPAMQKVRPGTFGYFRGEHRDFASAAAHAEHDAYCDDHWQERSIPEDFPSLALERFFWPVSEGTTRAALAIVREDGRLLARVVGMSRETDAFEPGVWAEIDITDLAATVAQAR